MIAFLGYPESVWRWLEVTDRIPAQVINDVLGALVGLIVIGMIVRPAVLRLQRFVVRGWRDRERAVVHAWRDHIDTQHRIADAQEQTVASNKVIADRLDPSTPGGIADLIAAVKEKS